MSAYELLLDGSPANAELSQRLSLIEVEEGVDLPAALELTVSVCADDSGDLTRTNDRELAPFANVALVVNADEHTPQCLFDGYVLSHKLHLETGTKDSSLKVWAQDATWLMNLEEKVKEWVDVTDSAVAAAIFGDYGITPGSTNDLDDSPAHTEQKHTLMQRGSDIQFLRTLAQRNGKLCRVTCDDKPGDRTGWFLTPDLAARPLVTIRANTLDEPVVDTLDFSWDISHPTAVQTRQALFDDPSEDGVSGDTAACGLPPLAARDLSTFAGKPMSVQLTTTVDDDGELLLRAESVLREAAWFVRCEGETDATRLKAVLRAGTIVEIEAVGSVFSGRYFVWSVRHSITHESHKMKFVLVRNAVGGTP